MTVESPGVGKLGKVELVAVEGEQVHDLHYLIGADEFAAESLTGDEYLVIVEALPLDGSDQASE